MTALNEVAPPLIRRLYLRVRLLRTRVLTGRTLSRLLARCGLSRTDFQRFLPRYKSGGPAAYRGPARPSVSFRQLAAVLRSIKAAAAPSPMTPAAAPSPMTVEPAKGMA